MAILLGTKEIHGHVNFEGRCESSVSPSATWAFLFNFPCPVGQCVQGSSRKMWVSSRALEIFLFTFLDWPNFHFAEYFFLFWMPSKMLCGMDSNYFFALTMMRKDSDRQFQARQKAAESTWSSCSASGCCAEFVDIAKQIMKTVSLSSTQQVALDCVCFRLLLAKASDSACGQNP